MRVRADVKPYVTFADYLASERSSDVKHEWFDGAVYAMSRGTPSTRGSVHGSCGYFAALPVECEVYSSDLMLYVADLKLSTYADASVVCGPLETITVKRNGKSLGEAVTNPVVIIEVLSDSTERYDREEKFAYFRTLPSLQEFVLIAQDEVAIEVFRRPAAARRNALAGSPREPGDRWDGERAGPSGFVTIHGSSISVDAVYGARD